MTKAYLNLPKRAARYSSRRFPQHAFSNVAYKEDAPKTAEEIEAQLKTMETSLEQKAKEASELAATNLKTDFEGQLNVVKALIEKVKGVPEGFDIADMNEKLTKTIDGFDKMQARLKGFKINGIERKILTIGEAIGQKMLEFGKVDEKSGQFVSDEIEQSLRSAGGSFTLKLGTVLLKVQGADMTQANSLTGDPVATYNQRQALIPAQKVNFRDLIPTVQSPTGLYVTYSENVGGTNNITTQTEGATKGQNEYDLTEVKQVAKYIAGFAVITKQLIRNLPFIQGALTRMLLRDFYKAENAYFYTTAVNAATGGTIGGTSPDDILQLIALIGAQLDTNYNVSYIVVSNTLMARLISGTYSKGYYPGAGSVVLNDSRGLTLFGVPVVAASWVTANYALLIDNDYIERIEVEGLNVTYSFEDATNFRQNKVTVKVECFEELNPMVGASIISMNLGAS